ncbi:transposase [Massilia aerilata]|uniref:Transposase n=1 Tax=Massilia aerilata TaxID=453817 RepID=A0ABW0S2D3_9BURK
MTKYDKQFKSSVVAQYLRGDGGYRSIANKHGLGYGMVRRWVLAFQARAVRLPSRAASLLAPANRLLSRRPQAPPLPEPALPSLAQ